jgi:uncharacterized protein involved in exopolysaccharide biosynthesis/Mrp family chromosome partitioning ATPase
VQATPRTETAETSLDLGALSRAFARNRMRILVPTLLTLVGATVIVNVITPRFTAETRILLENRDSFYTRADRDVAGRTDPQIDQEAVTSQIQLVKSIDLAKTIIARNNLAEVEEFEGGPVNMPSWKKLLVLLGIVKNPLLSTPEDRVMREFQERMKVFAVARSRILVVEFESEQPELARKLSEDVAEAYLRMLADAKKTTAQSAGNWLGRNVDQLRQRVTEAESKVEAFRTRNGLFIGTNNTSISAQQLAELNTQLASARSQQADLQSKVRTIREAIRGGRAFEVSDVINNEVVRRLIEQRATLRAQIAQEERTLLPQHPRMKELYAQLGGLDAQVRAAAERAARALENDARAAGARVTSVMAELDAQKQLAATANESEVQLRALEREARAEREQLEGYLTRLRDAQAREGDNAVPADARIVSRAVVPAHPSYPKKGPVILLSTLGVLITALTLVAVRALLSGEALVQSARLEPRLDMPEAAAVDTVRREPLGAEAATSSEPSAAPRSRADAAGPVPDGLSPLVSSLIKPHEPAADPDAVPSQPAAPVRKAAAPPARAPSETPLRTVQHAVERAWSPDRAVSLLAVSAEPGLTTTRVLLALARQLSERQRVVIADLQDQPRRLDSVIGTRAPAGIAEVLMGQTSFLNAIHRDKRSKLHILPAGQLRANLAEHGDGLALALDGLSQTYDVVILDTGPMSPAFAALATAADVVAVVGPADKAHVLQQAADGLVALGAVPPIQLTPPDVARSETAERPAEPVLALAG